MRSSLFVLLVALLQVPSAAFAGGLDLGDNGTISMGRAGAYTAAVDEPSALYYNPSALSQIDGFALTLNTHLWFNDLVFQRAPLTVEQPGDDPTYAFSASEIQNEVFPAPMLFMSHDFGLEDWTFGLGAFGPSSVGHTRMTAPNLEELGQISVTDTTERDFGHGFLLEEQDLLLIYFSGAVAYDFGPLELGLTLSLAYLDVEFINAEDGGGALNVTEDAIENPSLYTRSQLNVNALTMTGTLGLTYRPIDALTLALAYRPRHALEADGTLAVTFPEGVAPFSLALNNDGAHLAMTMPDVVRFGARWAFDNGSREIADLELDLVYEGWSQTESFVIDFDGQIVSTDANFQGLIGERQLPQVVIPRGFDDTLSVRLGSDINISEQLTVRAGTSYEGALGNFFDQGTVRPGFANIDFLPLQRLAVSLGASYHIADWSIDLAFMHVFSPTHEETDGQIDILYPLWTCQDPQDEATAQACAERETSPLHPINEGTYDVSYDLLSLGFTLNLD